MAFVALSTLIVIVGFVFYIQLRNLIEPLTPLSIPHGVDQLDTSIERNNFLFRFLYQEQLVEFNLEDYVLTQRLTALQDFYMNKEILYQLIKEAKQNYPLLWRDLEESFPKVESMWNQIINYMQSNDKSTARQLLESVQYTDLTQSIKRSLNAYTKQFDVAQNESSIVALKVASKNTREKLEESLNSSLIIFIDAILLSVLLAYFSARTISRPIKLLKEDIENIDINNHSTYINPQLLQLKGEVGELARAYVDLINKLRTTTVSRDKLLIEVEKRKQIEHDLRRTAARLRQTIQDLDQFAYGVSHDLREPLRGIENLSEWITEDCGDILPDSSRKHLKLMQNRVRRLGSLINGILEYSRAGKIRENKESVNLNKLVKNIISDLAPPEGVEIIIDHKLPTMVTYKAAITQVFLNLISNGIKYLNKPEGMINIGCKTGSEYYQFYVSDNGPGIEPQYHEKIFLMFQTLQPRDVIESAGIGLALVKKIVEGVGGKVWIESKVGSGSTFYFTWPKSD